MVLSRDSGPGTPDIAPGSDAGGRSAPDPFITGLLARELAKLVDRLATYPDLFRSRGVHDEALQHYAATLARDLESARAIAARLLAFAGAAAPEPRRIPFARFVQLRARMWQVLAPAIPVEVSVDDDAPFVAAAPTVLGRVLDDLFGTLLATAAAPARVRIEVSAAPVDDQEAAAHPGLRRGRYARWIGALPHAKGPLVSAAPHGALLERAVAVLKGYGGYLETARDAGHHVARLEAFLPAAPGPVATGRRNAPSLLVVDDDAALRGLAAEMLRAEDYAVVECGSGDEALAAYRDGARFDLVLLDLTMPGLDGLQTMRALRAIDPSVSVLVVSGSVTAKSLRAMLAEGLLGFVPKPFGMRQLLEAVRALV